ncbi:MAG: hypothetical protein SPL69_13095 [Succinivibrionaceae bacterium]|nr:hypothetical protein [Succinivibrionaceae bacterium]
MGMTIDERLNRIEQFFKGKNSEKKKDGVVNIVLGKRMVPVAGASANSAELLTKADFCTAFTYIALTKGMPHINNDWGKVIDYAKKASEKCFWHDQVNGAVICECAGGVECQAYPRDAFDMFGVFGGLQKAFGLDDGVALDIDRILFNMNEAFDEGMKLHPAAVRESVKSGLSEEIEDFHTYIKHRETPDAEYVKAIQRIKNNASVSIRNRINKAKPGESEQTAESKASKRLSFKLRGEAVFLGVMEGVEGWARIIWKKNPQLLDFYKTGRLASVASKLQNYGSNENLRFIWAKVGVPVDFFNGQDFEWRIVKVESCDELKKALVESARSFIPDADNMSPGMESWFWDTGIDWMNRGVPTRWQEFNEYCSDPDYDGSLSWDED